jgi:hypothetical protein
MFSVASSSAAIEDTLSQCSRPRQPHPHPHPQQTRGSGGTIQNYFLAHSTGKEYTGSGYVTRRDVDEEEEFCARSESSPEADPSEASECSDGAEPYEKPKQKKRNRRLRKMNSSKHISSEEVQESQEWIEKLSPEKKTQRATRSSNSSSRGVSVSVGDGSGSRAPGTRQIRADAALSTAKMPASPSCEYEESIQSTTSQAALFLRLSDGSAKPKEKTIVEIDQEENGIGMNAKTIVTDSCFGPSSTKENEDGFGMNETNEFRGPNHTKPRCLDRETSLKAVLSRSNSEQIDFKRQRLGKENTAAAAGASNNDRDVQCSDENEENEENDENEYMARNMVLSSDHRSECSDALVSFSSKRPPSSSSSSSSSSGSSPSPSPSSHSASMNKETVASAGAHPGLSSPSPAKMFVDIVMKVVAQSGPFSSASKAAAARGGRLVAREECHADTLVDDAVEGSANTDEMYFHDENPPVVRGAAAAGSVDFDAYKHVEETTDVDADADGADGADGGGTDSNADAGLGSTRRGREHGGGSASSSSSSSRSSNPSGRRVPSADGDAVDSPGPRRSSRVEGSSSSSSHRSGHRNGGAHGGERDHTEEDGEGVGGQADAASDGIADMRRWRCDDDGDGDGNGDGEAESDHGTGRAKRKSAEMDARTARSSGNASGSRGRKTTHQMLEMEMETEGRGVRGGRTRGTAGACNSNNNNSSSSSSSSSIYERNDLSVYTTPDDPPPPSAQRPGNSAAGVGSGGSSGGGATEFLSYFSATLNSGFSKLLGTGTAVCGKNGGVIANAGDENSNSADSAGGVAAAAVSARGTRGGAATVAMAGAGAGAAPSSESKRRKVDTASTVVVDLTD